HPVGLRAGLTPIGRRVNEGRGQGMPRKRARWAATVSHSCELPTIPCSSTAAGASGGPHSRRYSRRPPMVGLVSRGVVSVVLIVLSPRTDRLAHCTKPTEPVADQAFA